MITPYSNTISVTTEKFPFAFTVKTDNGGVSASNEFKMPLTTSVGLNINVDWGDGSPVENITDHNLAIHTYASAGTYTIKVLGSLLGWQFNNGGDRLKILNISSWGVLNISVDSGFRGCSNLTCSATDAPIVTTNSLIGYFRSCTNFNGAIGNWNVSSVENMFTLFAFANNFNQDISNWDVSNVVDMSLMFQSTTSFNQDISSWNVSNVQYMQAMFRLSIFNQDISNWDINKVSDFNNFMLDATGLSTTNYDLLLVGWEATLQAEYPSGLGYPYTISINFGGSACSPAVKAGARQSLINNFGWTITDATP